MKLTIDGNYHQFYLEDGILPKNTCDDFWTDDAYKRHLAITEGCLAFGTMTSLELDVAIELLDAEPELAEHEFDHLVEASIVVKEGALVVCGCVDLRSDGPQIKVSNGEYRVRYGIKGIATVKNEFDGNETYHLFIWPKPYEPVNVVKQQTIYS